MSDVRIRPIESAADVVIAPGLSRDSSISPQPCARRGLYGADVRVRPVDQVSPAMIGGIGFRYRLRGIDLFTEARIHGLTNGRNWGSVFMPVTFGVRFD